MATLDDFSRIVATVYSSVMAPENWTVALGELRHTLDVHSCALIRADGNGRSVQAAHLAPQVRLDYEQYYHRIDYVLEAVEQSPVGVLRSGRSLVDLQRDSEFNVDWLSPLEMTDGLFVRLTDGPAPLMFLAAGPRPPTPFVPLVNALVPHLQQALRSQAHLERLRRCADDLSALSEALGHAVIVVTTDSQIVYTNSAAEQLLRSADGLLVRAGRLEAAAAKADAALRCSIRAAVTPGDNHPAGNSLLCARASGHRPYVIEVLPSGPPGATGSARHAIVVVADPEHESDTAPALLRRHYGLTPGETEIAVMVLNGGGVKDIAERMSLSQATVKTHLQHVFDKTGTHRQADLIRLLLGLRSPCR
ncbi:LuxR family transcriptional regulator [Mycolicibacter terrae]|uniref:LuxR family transcriptional regulator n=1 Tax=Mycolicibacter terrae TaxID=1788 RepID=A0AAD1MGQ7_9MYCO|nr:LuxR C-terminal-related transcriptional regulator [Mycolicibacter terrae]BBX21896.1 LuxR family transcriptional regulator [Mycolicibacter terrae]SNV83076.1 LuxR family transcriptional regulator [Mycolicibacter terrae]